VRTISLGLVATVLVGCADKAPAPASAPAGAAAAPVAPPVVEITANEYAFTVPDTIPGGWVTIRVTNQGKELHHVQLFRLDQAKTIADFAKWREPAFPDWAVATGGPTGTPPTATNTAIVRLTPGNYVAICVIPSADGKPHLMKGMIKALTVIAPPKPATPAAADVAVTLTDFDFTFTVPLASGKHLLRVETTSSQPHEIVIAKLPAGKTPADILAWVDKQVGPPPVESIVGSSGVSKGEVNLVPIDLAPGDYALMCFMLDGKDGKLHAVHGMMKQIKVS
jgi:hypothetical protein